VLRSDAGRSTPADRFDHVILRKWKAKDDGGNKAECTQVIDELKIPVFVDVLPDCILVP
jgi:hypothetical protein